MNHAHKSCECFRAGIGNRRILQKFLQKLRQNQGTDIFSTPFEILIDVHVFTVVEASDFLPGVPVAEVTLHGSRRGPTSC
jgi:hypothetical protein